jgi:hypothetical protein
MQVDPAKTSHQYTKGHTTFSDNSKIKLILDYDGTYAFNNNDRYGPKQQDVFKKWDSFIENSAGDISLTISTGRNSDSFRYCINNEFKQLIDYGHRHFIPANLITRCGGEKYICSYPQSNPANLSKPWNGDELPDQYKLKLIKHLANWDRRLIHQIITNIASVKGITIEHERHESNIEALFIRDDGNLNIFAGFPLSMDETERSKFINRLLYDLNSNHIKYYLLLIIRDDDNMGGSSIHIYPKLSKKELKYRYDIIINKCYRHYDLFCLEDNGKEFESLDGIGVNDTCIPTKSFDIAIEIRAAMKNNQLIVVAGDHMIDIPMLDIESYILKDSPIHLPFIGIVVGDFEPVNNLIDNRYIHKASSPASLPDMAKELIREYAIKNPPFLEGLNVSMLKELNLYKD